MAEVIPSTRISSHSRSLPMSAKLTRYLPALVGLALALALAVARFVPALAGVIEWQK